MSPASEKFLSDIQNDDADVRYAAWRRAGEVDPEVAPQLGKLLTAEKPGVRKAADEALKRMVHSVGKQTGGARRAALVRALGAMTADGNSKWARTVALRHLSLIGGDESAPLAAKLLANADLQEEAAFCLERIPGTAATRAFMAALGSASDAFKPRILAALGHRRAEEATEVCAAAVESKNPEIAVAAMKAVARIGKRPDTNVTPPDFDSLSGWHRVDYWDSALRFADDQVRRGNTAEALKHYARVLQREEEHLQCAAIIGLSKTGHPQAAALIDAKVTSPINNVRITAEKARRAMKG